MGRSDIHVTNGMLLFHRRCVEYRIHWRTMIFPIATRFNWSRIQQNLLADAREKKARTASPSMDFCITLLKGRRKGFPGPALRAASTVRPKGDEWCLLRGEIGRRYQLGTRLPCHRERLRRFADHRDRHTIILLVSLQELRIVYPNIASSSPSRPIDEIYCFSGARHSKLLLRFWYLNTLNGVFISPYCKIYCINLGARHIVATASTLPLSSHVRQFSNCIAVRCKFGPPIANPYLLLESFTRAHLGYLSCMHGTSVRTCFVALIHTV